MLSRDIGVFGATMMGLGSIVGTGIFVSIGIAAGYSGPSVILAIAIASLVANCNALSSAQLAAAHAVSGGTYEYGYHYLHPSLGFTAGWMFLCAKTASAATAALGFSGYLIHLFGWSSIPIRPIAASISLIFTFLVLNGLKRTNWTNIVIVSVTLLSLTTFVLCGLSSLLFEHGKANLTPIFPTSERGFFYSTALMFVAYTGYARIATLAEEIRNPRRYIPIAIMITLVISAILYISVGVVAVGIVGSETLAAVTKNSATPLEIVARKMGIPGLGLIVATGACTAMLGVLLNLILGLSRVVLAMGRQGDLPALFAQISHRRQTPSAAVIGVGIAVAGLTLIGNVETTWAFSAFTILIYYSITNLSALYLPRTERLYHPIIAVLGLVSCLFLAFWVPSQIWITGVLLITGGFIWHLIIRYINIFN